MIKCPACGHDNVDGTMFCEMCGEEVQAEGGGESTPSADAAVSGGDIQCPACENMNPPENVVCEVCGTALRDRGDDDDTELEDIPVPTMSTPAAAGDDATTADAAVSADTSATQSSDPDLAGAAPPASTPDSDTADATAPDATTEPDIPAPSASLQPGQVKLVVEQGMTVGKQFVLGDAEMLVGREDADDNVYPDIDLADQDEGYVHRRHASLKFENDRLFVTHLGGANKTRLNNKPIPDDEAQAVSLGDKLAFGKVVVRVVPLA